MTGVLLKKRKSGPRRTQRLPCEGAGSDTFVRRFPSKTAGKPAEAGDRCGTDLLESLQKEAILPAPSSWTLGPQPWDNTFLLVEATWFLVLGYHGPGKLTQQLGLISDSVLSLTSHNQSAKFHSLSLHNTPRFCSLPTPLLGPLTQAIDTSSRGFAKAS